MLWLSNKPKDSIDVVIDGANVGFFEQNFKGAPKRVDYEQIDWIARHFEEQNMKPLIFLHQRHFKSKMLPKWANAIVDRWTKQDLVYKTPYDSNDDWYWLHTALHAGPDTMVLTNDECRDHHFQMLAQRSFARWKERHQIRFSFGSWTYTGARKHRLVLLNYPQVYSRRIQYVSNGFVIPQPKNNDESNDVEHKDDPEQESYTCILRKM